VGAYLTDIFPEVFQLGSGEKLSVIVDGVPGERHLWSVKCK
jgi:hypothetical protein